MATEVEKETQIQDISPYKVTGNEGEISAQTTLCSFTPAFLDRLLGVGVGMAIEARYMYAVLPTWWRLNFWRFRNCEWHKPRSLAIGGGGVRGHAPGFFQK